jgi:pyroglutamyl-peptidase
VKKTVLLTGFEPFGHDTINPSWEAVRALDGWQGEGFAVAAFRLPCVFGLASELLAAQLGQLRPDLVIAVGQAGGRAGLSVERIAINVDDAPFADNRQHQPVDLPIVEGGPAAYFGTLPIKAIVGALRARGLEAAVSDSAGTYVCNHVFYGLMHHVAGSGVRAGFIHVPYLPEQAAACPGGAPGMSLDEIVAGLRIAVEVAIG